MKKQKLVSHVFIFIFLLIALPSWVIADNVSKMTKESLKTILEKTEVTILDVRQGRDWSASEFKIQGAQRVDPGDFDKWSEKFPKNQVLVLYCA